MKILKIILHLINKHKWGYLLLSLELFISSLVFLSVIGKIQCTYSSSNIANTFNGSNSFYFTPFQFYNEQEHPLKNILQEKADFDFKLGEIYSLVLKDSSNQIITAYGYNDEIIENANFKMSSGEWFGKLLDEEYIPVISLEKKYKLGDVIDIMGTKDGNGKKAYVIGTINKDDYILTFMSGGSKDFARIGDFISTSNAQFIIPYNSNTYPTITETDTIQNSKQPGTIIIADDRTVFDEVYNICKNYGAVSNISIMKENYNNDLRNFYYTNGIVLFIFTLLTLVGIGGFNGIQSMLNERVFTVYYMLGLSKNKCMLIEGMRTFILLIINFAVIILAYSFKLKELFLPKLYKINKFTFALIFLYLSIVCIASSIGYVHKLAKKNLIQIYKKRA